MELSLQKGNIVILADAHNPSILSPQWIKDKLEVKEECREFVNTPQFSVYDADKMMLLVDNQRLQLSLKDDKDNKVQPDALTYLSDLATRYVDRLPEIPYKSMGLNLFFMAQASDANEKIGIETVFHSLANMSEIEKNHDSIQFGSIIHARRDDYILKLTIEPQGMGPFLLSFNYHFELGGLEAKTITRHLKEYSELYEQSVSMINKHESVSRGE